MLFWLNNLYSAYRVCIMSPDVAAAKSRWSGVLTIDGMSLAASLCMRATVCVHEVSNICDGVFGREVLHKQACIYISDFDACGTSGNEVEPAHSNVLCAAAKGTDVSWLILVLSTAAGPIADLDS